VGKREVILDRSLRIPWFRDDVMEKMRIAVIGIGNTGSYTATMLYGLAPKELWLIDKDVVELTNVQRQFIFSEEDEGRAKVHAARDFLLGRFRGHGTKVKPVVADVRYFSWDFKPDFVFCCVDNNEARKAVLEHCLRKDIPMIDMGLEFHESQAGHVLLVDRSALPDGACVNCYMDLGRRIKREAGCIAAGIPYSGAMVASIAVGMFIQHTFRKLRANYYFIDLNSQHVKFALLKRRENCSLCSDVSPA